ncbi:hypothetical protein [uncultured Desulfobacter sp.]|uniref:hypothetical protein n=1 Tax=uncultured Desulfobacter sp. TaxID=240139 RepID=UPI002AA61B7F|nr:hypothetical protein [uncultured Desulfobacter sp.]
MTPEEKEKLEAEAEKLRAEASSLRKGGWSKPSSWVPLLVAIAAIGTSIGQYQVSSFKEKEAALDAREKVVEAKEEESQLKDRNKKLEKRANELTEYISQATTQMSQLQDEIRTANNELLAVAEKKNIGPEKIAELERSIEKRTKKAESIVASAKKRNAEVELQNLVWQMNSEFKPDRLAAVAKLIESHSDSQAAVEYAVELITMPQLESLSASGRINVLVFLRNTKPIAWNKELLSGVDAAIDEIKNRAETGNAYIGPQTEEAINKLQRHVNEITHNKAN